MSSGIPRRDFLKNSVAWAVGVGAGHFNFPRAGQAVAPAVGAEVEWRNKQPEMRYRRLGRTGFMISEIVCGGDPISPTNNRHVELAIEMGLNYLDTAPDYGRGQSEVGYSGVIQGSKRDRVFINTKVSPFASTRFEAYQRMFAGLDRNTQAAILREANEDIELRRVMAPDYFGNYFNAKPRFIQGLQRIKRRRRELQFIATNDVRLVSAT